MKLLVSIAALVLLAASLGFGMRQTENQQTPSAQPQAEPAPAEPQTEAPKPTQPQGPELGKTEAPSTTKPKSTVHKRKKRNPAISKPAGTQPSKVIVRNGGAKDTSPQIAPAMTKEYELHQRATTAQLLATTDANLKKIAGRQLPPGQQSMLDEIHTYAQQAKAASDAGDLERAHTLALKAHLLSDDLVRR